MSLINKKNTIIETSTPNTGIGWLLKMAWRDSRKNKGRLLLFISTIILGIAALVAINAFQENLYNQINSQSKELLGADLVVEASKKVVPQVEEKLKAIESEQSSEISFASMVLFPKTGGTRLVQIRGLEGNFPWYGKINTDPVNASANFQKERKALVDRTVMLQFGVEVGDSLKIGDSFFEISGALKSVPGQSGITSTVAPAVYIGKQYLEETNLLQKGSRLFYNYYYRFDEDEQLETVLKDLTPVLDKEGLDFSTVESRKMRIGKSFNNMGTFLNLVSFVALILGCIGVSSSIFIYIKGKLNTVAVLRCLGVKSTNVFAIYLLQILVMGLIGAILGAILGTSIQYLLPIVFKDFLPVEITMQISWRAIIQGILTGLGMAVLFALVPLLGIRKVSPLRVLRVSNEDGGKRDFLIWGIYVLILFAVFGFAWLQTSGWQEALAFTGFILFSLLILAGIAKLVMVLIRKFFPQSWGYVWRQGLANLYRPNNQTLILIVSIGLGTALISCLFFIQNLLMSQVEFTGRNNQPNTILFDIQSDQRAEISELTRSFDLPVIQQVPLVTMRVSGINGRSADEILSDTTNTIRAEWLTRENRVTFRDSLINTEKISAGTFYPSVNNPDDTIFISIAERFARGLKLDIGDQVTFDVQGVPIETVVGSKREIDWRRIQTNFLVLFPTGVLEEAPQFNVLVTRTPSNEVAAQFQQAIVKQFPNVSVVDLTLILKTVEDLLNKVSFVIQFMALFSIITGLLVLIGSVIISKFQRIKESVLLRTLGASRQQILKINLGEYFILGSIASLVGILLALLGSWLLAYYVFEVPFVPAIMPMVWIYFAITGLTILIGLLNSREILNRPPLEVLRNSER